jgi:hypothetical protein
MAVHLSNSTTGSGACRSCEATVCCLLRLCSVLAYIVLHVAQADLMLALLSISLTCWTAWVLRSATVGLPVSGTQ